MPQDNYGPKKAKLKFKVPNVKVAPTPKPKVSKTPTPRTPEKAMRILERNRAKYELKYGHQPSDKQLTKFIASK
tara:strand:- start:59 stop:280 length:222 start_codon:yes stop_codon:yes gene_type:complete